MISEEDSGGVAGMAQRRRQALQDRMTRHPASGRPSPAGLSAAAGGCLIVVTPADQPVIDLLLTAVRRRIPDTAIEFPKRITTRRSGSSDADIVVSRNLFREIERDGAFIAKWEAGGHRFGLPGTVREILERGRSAVIAAPAEIIPELQEIVPDVRVVRLGDRLHAARAQLSPRACLRRITGPRLAARLEATPTAPTTDAVFDPNDLPSAIRFLTEVLIRIERERESGSRTRRSSSALARRREKSTVDLMPLSR